MVPPARKKDAEAIGFYTHFSRLDTRGERERVRRRKGEKTRKRWMDQIESL
jgi:hypothetical protein